MAVDLEQYAFSFQHAIIKLQDRQFDAISNISFSQDIERSAIYGTARAPLKRSVGQVSLGEATVTFSDLDEALTFYDALGDDPSLATFSADVTFANEVGRVRSFELLSCALGGISGDFEAGADAVGMEYPLSFMRIKIDGKTFVK